MDFVTALGTCLCQLHTGTFYSLGMSLGEALDWELPVGAGVMARFAPDGRPLEISGRFFSCSLSLETFMCSQGGNLK